MLLPPVLPGRLRMSERRVQPPAPLTPLDWETLPAHPTVTAQPTATGRTVTALVPYRGTMLLGYGDWGTNTGPMAVVGYDLTSLDPVTLHGLVPSEAVDVFRTSGGRCYVPWIDPITVASEYEGYAGYTTDAPDGVWGNVSGAVMVHALDLAIAPDGRVLLCGSVLSAPGAETGVAAVLRQRPDGTPGTGGIGWDTVLSTGTPGPMTRFYGFHHDAGTIRVQTTYWEPPHATWASTDGGVTWSEEPGYPTLPRRPGDDTPPPSWLPLDGPVTAYTVHDGYAWAALGPEVRRAALVL